MEVASGMVIEKIRARAELLKKIARALKEAEASDVRNPEGVVDKLLRLRKQYKVWKIKEKP